MIKQILKMGGCKTEKEFYQKYPTEEAFIEAFPQARPLLEQYMSGGEAFTQQPTEAQFFNYGSSTMIPPYTFQMGGQNMQPQDDVLSMLVTQLVQQQGLNPNRIMEVFQKMPPQMIANLTTLAEQNPEQAAEMIMGMLSQDQNDPYTKAFAAGGSKLSKFTTPPTANQFYQQYPDINIPIATAQFGGTNVYTQYNDDTSMSPSMEEYGGSVFNYGQFPAIMKEGGVIPMNTENTYLPERLQSFMGKIHQLSEDNKMKEQQDMLLDQMGFMRKGGKVLPKHQTAPGQTGPGMAPWNTQGGYGYKLPYDLYDDMTLGQTPSYSITNYPLPIGPNTEQNNFYSVYDNQDFTNSTTGYFPEKFPPSLNTGKYSQMSEDEIKKDRRKESWWGKKTGIEKAETILGGLSFINSAAQRRKEREREKQLENQLFNPMNRFDSIAANRGDWDVNTAILRPDQYGQAQFTGMAKMGGSLPTAQSGLEVKMRAGLGFNANQLSWPVMAGEFSEPDMEARKTLLPVSREGANLEAEVGETTVTNLNGDGIPEQYKIGGKRHYDGGTPLNLPDNSYIFSRDNSMKIKDKGLLAQFGITSPPKGGVTPADIAKKYDLNKYKKVLLDKDSDDLARSTAEANIANANLKLGKLALIQESMKSFPDGLPFISMPYIESVGLTPDMFPTTEAQPEQPDMDMAQYGGPALPKAQTGIPDWNQYYDIINHKDPAVKEAGKLYQKAIQSEDEKSIQEAIDYLSKTDVPYSISTGLGQGLSWFTGNRPFGLSEQDMVGDMIDVLNIRKKDLENRTKQKEERSTSETNYKNAIDKKTLKVAELNKLLNTENRTIEQSNKIRLLNDEIKKINDYLITSQSPAIRYLGPSGGLGTPSTTIPNGYRGYPIPFGGTESTVSDEPAKPSEPAKPANSSSYDRLRYNNSDTPILDSIEQANNQNNVVLQAPLRPERKEQPAPKQKVNVIKPAQPSDKEISEMLKSLNPGVDPTPDEIKAFKTTMGYKKMGGSLPIHQTKGPVLYNLKDPELWAKAKEKNYNITQPWSWYNPNLPAIGKQSQLLPSGIYTTPGGPQPDISVLKNYPGITDWNEYDPGGYDKWVADMAAAKGKPSKASDFWAKKRKEYEMNTLGISSIDEKVPGWNVPGVELMTPYVFNQIQEQQAAAPPTTPPAAGVPDLGYKGIQDYYSANRSTPFFTEDIINMGAAFRNLADIKKYLPWQATSPFYAATPTLESPERQLAANAEQLAIGTAGAGQFAGPQAFNARFSEMSGKAAANAADILGAVNNRNVGTLNQFELANKQAYNAYMQNQADKATNMFDKWTIANQQYDNARREAKDIMRQNFVNAWKNRGMAATVNDLYANQYYWDPRTNTVRFNPNSKDFKITQPSISDMPEPLKTLFERGMAAGTKEGNDLAMRAWESYMDQKKGSSSKSKKKSSDDDEESNTDIKQLLLRLPLGIGS